jgi:hypothetical protein
LQVGIVSHNPEPHRGFSDLSFFQNPQTVPIRRHVSWVNMRTKDIDKAEAATERAELYYKAHLGSPSAVRRPRLMLLFIARLSQNHACGENRFLGMVPIQNRAASLELERGSGAISGRASAQSRVAIAPRARSSAQCLAGLRRPGLQEGTAGVGNTPCEALEDFNRHFMEPLISRNGHTPSLSA